MILHEEVPELVYLQTRRLLRDLHYMWAEHHRVVYASELGNGDAPTKQFKIGKMGNMLGSGRTVSVPVRQIKSKNINESNKTTGK